MARVGILSFNQVDGRPFQWVSKETAKELCLPDPNGGITHLRVSKWIIKEAVPHSTKSSDPGRFCNLISKLKITKVEKIEIFAQDHQGFLNYPIPDYTHRKAKFGTYQNWDLFNVKSTEYKTEEYRTTIKCLSSSGRIQKPSLCQEQSSKI